MKALLLFLILLAIVSGCTRHKSVAETQREISAQRTELARIHGSLSELRTAIENTRETVQKLDERLRIVEDRQMVAGSLQRQTGGAGSLSAARSGDGRGQNLLQGSYREGNGSLIYSADARLSLPNSTVISSPSGVMLSDPDQQIVEGDLMVEGKEGVTQAHGAVIEVDPEKTSLNAENVVIEPRKSSPNKTAEPTRTTVTPPADAGDRASGAPGSP